MRKKIFVTLFFDKITFLLLFLFLVSISSYLVLKQVHLWITEPKTIEIPDIEMTYSQDGEEQEKGSNKTFDETVKELEKLADANTEIYTMQAMDLYTYSTPFYQVTFRIYGTEQAFLQQFENQLAYGTVPIPGRTEVLVGYNAAMFYQFKVGDVINEKLGLDQEAGYEPYVVSGILEERDHYYGNGFYFIKENLQNPGETSEDNIVMIYSSSKKNYLKIVKAIKQRKSEKESISYIDNYRVKSREKNQPLQNMAFTLIVSFLLLQLEYFNISKGLEKKAGIIKALGIPDKCVLMVCGIGFGGLIVLTSLIVFVLSLIEFEMERTRLLFSLSVISLITFFLLFVQVAYQYKRIQPMASMPAK